MSSLRKMLKAYLGGKPKEPSLHDFVKATEKIRGPGFIIRAIEETANLGIPVTAAFFMRGIPSRYHRTGELMETIVGKGNRNTPIQHMSILDLKQAPSYVSEAYRTLIDEFYELAVMLHLSVKLFGAKKNIQNAKTEWEHYLYLADGHPQQKTRIKIAQEQLEYLSSIG